MTELDVDVSTLPTTDDPYPYGRRYPWIAMGVVLIGTFMVILDTTIVNVALPQIGIELGNTSGIEWVVTAYLLAVGLAQPPTGWLADKYGRKRIFIISLILFGTGSLLAALSPTLEILVATRVIQGLGGGALAPVGMAMAYELFPADRRGTALGVWGIAAMAAPAFGPVIGGYVVTTVSWHWLFLINVPVCVIAVTLAVRLLRDTGYRESRRFDGIGLGLVSVVLVSWLIAFAQASEWGWGSVGILTLIGIGAVFLVAFIAWERRVEHPAIDLEMFRVPIFSLTLVVVGAAIVVQYSILVFLPLQLETLRGLSALRVGTMMVPMAIGAAITFPLSGRLNDRIGPRYPVIAGTMLLGTSAWILAHLALDAPTIAIVAAVSVQGLGFGFAMMPNAVTALNALPMRYVASATAVRQLAQRVSASFGVAVLATVLATRLAQLDPNGTDPTAGQSAYQTVFTCAAALGVLATVLAVFLPGRQRNFELLSERSAEMNRAPAGTPVDAPVELA